jgi:UDP-glucose 4-epimerase
MKVVVTGAGGFVGGAVADHYEAGGHEVVRGTRENLRLPLLVSEEGILEDADLIIHCASTTHNYHILDEATRDMDVMTNCMGAITLLSSALRRCPAARIVNLSTFFVYGTNTGCDEETVCKPKALYGATKLCAENIFATFSNVYDMNTVSVRLANVYGPGTSGGQKKGALNWMIRKMVQNEQFDLYGWSAKRDFLFIEDAVAGIAAIAGSNLSGPVNLGTGEGLMVADFVDTAKDIIGFPPIYRPYRIVQPPDFHNRVGPKSCVMDVRKARSTGWRAKTPLNAGIRKTIEWMRGE